MQMPSPVVALPQRTPLPVTADAAPGPGADSTTPPARPHRTPRREAYVGAMLAGATMPAITGMAIGGGLAAQVLNEAGRVHGSTLARGVALGAVAGGLVVGAFGAGGGALYASVVNGRLRSEGLHDPDAPIPTTDVARGRDLRRDERRAGGAGGRRAGRPLRCSVRSAAWVAPCSAASPGSRSARSPVPRQARSSARAC
jgi:hypothetical protein